MHIKQFRSFIFLSVLLFWMGCGGYSATEQVTTEEVEKLRVDYEKGEIKTVKEIIAVFTDEQQPMDSRMAALKALGETEHPDAKAALRSYMQKAQDVNYGLLMATANQLIDKQTTTDISAVVEGIGSAQQKYTQFRTNLMRNIKQTDIAPQIESLLRIYQIEKENYTQMQESLTRVLGGVADERVIPILINIAKDKTLKPSVRSLALEVLGRKQHPMITQTFIEMLQDPDDQLRLRDFALEAMGDIKESRVILALLEAYNQNKQDYFYLLKTLTRALGDFSDPEVGPALVEIAKDPQIPQTTRRDAIQALIKYQDPEIFLQLLPLMENPDNYVLYDEMKAMAEAIGARNLLQGLRAKALQAQKSVTGTP